MRRCFIFLASCAVLFNALPAFAHPPKIELVYDQELQTLKITITHITNNPREHYIRALMVYKDDEEDPIQDIRSVMQKHPTQYTEEIPLELQSGDKITVKGICSEKGYKVETLLIP